MNSKEKDGISIVNIIFAILIVAVIVLMCVIYLSGNKKYKETGTHVEETTEETTEEITEEIAAEIMNENSNTKEYAVTDEINLKRSGAAPAQLESNEDYIFPDSDSRMLSKDELMDKTAQELKIARNEIYARHGREFTDESVQEYFNEKSWYTPIYAPEDFDKKGDEWFNDYEYANKTLIAEVEEELGYR